MSRAVSTVVRWEVYNSVKFVWIIFHPWQRLPQCEGKRKAMGKEGEGEEEEIHKRGTER